MRPSCGILRIAPDPPPLKWSSLRYGFRAERSYRLPAGVATKAVRAYLAGCPLVHSDVSAHRAILDEIDLLEFDDLAGHLADSIKNEHSAEELIGADDAAIRRF